MGRHLRNHRFPLLRASQTHPAESGQVQKFRRWPSDLARYFEFKKRVLKTHPSMEKFVLEDKLHWPDPPIAHSTVPYTDPRICPPLHTNMGLGDFQIRINDWPYAFLPDVTHIVVWSAFRFAAGTKGDEQMSHYDRFVKKHFGEIAEENRRWFLNFGSIQSVPGLEVLIQLVVTDLRVAFSCLVEECSSEYACRSLVLLDRLREGWVEISRMWFWSPKFIKTV